MADKYPKNYAAGSNKTPAFCPVCGSKLESGMVFCTSCGADLRKAGNLMEDVYNGPEFFDEPVDIDEPMTVIYGGPEMMFESFARKEAEKDDNPLEGLYAAPKPKLGILGKIKDKLEK